MNALGRHLHVSWRVPELIWQFLRRTFALATAEAWFKRRIGGIGTKTFDVIALTGVPVFAALFTRMQLAPVRIDAWLYYAYGTDFRPLLARFGWTYYASRLSWNLLVALYFLIFSPATALFALGVTVSCLGSISLYLILRHYYSGRVAFLTAFALAANCWYLGDTFWLYVDGPAIASSLASIACFLHGIRSGRRRVFCLSGMAFTIGMNAHPVVVFLVLPALGLIVISERMILSRRAWTGIALFGAAVTMTMLALCMTAWLAFGNPWFFQASISAADWVVSGGWHNWVVPFSSWIRGATAFFMPAGLLLAAAIVFGQEAVRRQVQPDTWIFAYAIFLGLCIVVSDVLMDAGRLQHFYYFIYLWVPAFLLLGSVNARLIEADSGRMTAAVVGSWIVSLGTLLLGGEYWGLYSGHPIRLMVAAYVLIAVLLLTFVSAVTLIGRHNGFVQLLGVVAGVAFVSISCATDMRIEAERLLWQPTDARPDFQTTVDAQRFVETNLVPDRRLLIWYNEKSSQQSELTAISSTFLFGYAQLNRSLPDLTDADLQKLDVPAVVVLLSMNPQHAAQALEVLHKRGIPERVMAKTVVGLPGRQISIWIVDTNPTGDTTRLASGDFSTRANGGIGQITRPLPIDWKHVVLPSGSSVGANGHWPLIIATPAQPWGYGVVLPYSTDAQALMAPFRVLIRARVLKGKAGFGLLNHSENAFVQREFFSASPDPITFELASANDHDIGPLVIQTADAASSARVSVDAIDVVASLAPVPLTVDWSNIERPTAPLTGFPMLIQTAARAQQNTVTIPCQIAQVPNGAPLWIVLRARVLAGEAVFSLMGGPDGSSQQKMTMSASGESRTIVMRTTGGANPIRLVIENAAESGAATIIIDSIRAATMS